MKPKVLGFFIVLLVLFLAPSLCAQTAGPVQYFYDDLGRLTKVVDQTGKIASYRYDPVGNLLSITRSTLPANNGLAILNFTPQRGSTGTAVTIQGQGFSSSTVVQFNGTAAVVTSVTASSLVVSVPSGSTTGPISVTVGTASAVSDTNFVVISPVLSSIALTPAGSSIPTGVQRQIVALGTYNDGSSRDLTTSVTWSSSALSVATISNSAGSQGLATGVNVGVTTITATSGSVSSSTSLTVTQPVLVSLAVTPATLSLPKGEAQQLFATGTLNNGSTQDLTVIASWTSSAGGVATESNFPGFIGRVTASAVGTANISASYFGLGASAVVTVTPAVPLGLTISPATTSVSVGSAVQFTATGQMSDGTTQNVTSAVSWNSADITVATISNTAPSQGLATGVSGGAVTITAVSGSVSGSASLFVSSTAGTVFPRFAFVANANDDTISFYTVDATSGQFRSNGYAAEQPGSKPKAVALDPTNQFLFVANSGLNNLAAYTVNAATGTLSQIAGSPFAVGSTPTSVAVDPKANFVYVVNSNDVPGDVSAFAFDPTTGSLTPVPGSPFPVGNGPSSVAVDPAGQFLYVTNTVDGTVSAFTIGVSSGALAAVAGSPFAAGTQPEGITVDSAGGFVLVADAGAPPPPPSSKLMPPRFAEPGSFLTASWREHIWKGDPSEFAAASGVGFRDARFAPQGKTQFSGGWDFNLFAHENAALSVAASELPGISPLRSVAYALPQSGNPLANSPGVSVFAMDPSSGALTVVSGSPFSTGIFQAAISVVTDSTGKFAYVTTGSGGISALTIDPASGVASLLPGSPYATSYSPSSVVVDPSGLFVCVTDSGASEVNVFGITPDTGELVSLRSIPTRGGPAAIAISAGSAPIKYVPQFAYVADSGGPAASGNTTGSNNVFGFSIDPTAGGLTSLSGSPFAEGLFPEFAVTDPFGRFLYLANNCSASTCPGTAGSVSAFLINSTTGALATVPGSPFVAGAGTLAAAVDPSGRFAYVVNGQDDTISGYSIAPVSGALTPIPGSPFATGATSGASLALAIDPTGQFLYAVTGCPSSTCDVGTISTYVISPVTGSLTLQFAPQSFGLSPSSAVVEPGGEFLYVTDSAAGDVIGIFLGDATYGLFALYNSPFAAGSAPAAIAVDPSARFLYVANSASNNISAYTIDPAGSGSLTQMQGSPFAAGANPASVTVDVSGKFVYVVNQGDNTVSVFSIDPALGVLTPAVGSPFPAGTVPVSVTVTGRIQ